jgi:hypothetical protein
VAIAVIAIVALSLDARLILHVLFLIQFVVFFLQCSGVIIFLLQVLVINNRRRIRRLTTACSVGLLGELSNVAVASGPISLKISSKSWSLPALAITSSP